jgi:O-methyltransferase involved in polyketide biosynthesis
MTSVDRAAGADSPGFDPSKLNAARIYDYWLGGKDNFAADREAAEQVIGYAPEVPRLARENRRFLGRVVRFLAAAGIRQFIDIGTGLPTQGHVHEVLRAVAPDARVAYVDHDPVVLVHARALLKDSDHVSVIQGDLRDPDALVRDPRLLELIDLERPVAVLLLAVLHLVGDDEEAAHAVTRLRAAMAPGSYLAISHAVCRQDENNEAITNILKLYNAGPMKDAKRRLLRAEKDVLVFFGDLEFVAPGFVPLADWRPYPGERTPAPASIWSIGGVAHKR